MNHETVHYVFLFRCFLCRLSRRTDNVTVLGGGRTVYQDRPCAGEGRTVQNYDRRTPQQQQEASYREWREKVIVHALFQQTAGPIRKRGSGYNRRACKEAESTYEFWRKERPRDHELIGALRYLMLSDCGGF